MQGEELEEGVIREDETNVDNEREEEQSWRSSSPEVAIESEYNPENGPRPAQRGRSLTGSQVRRHYRLQGVVPVRQEDSAEEDYPFSLSSDGL